MSENSHVIDSIALGIRARLYKLSNTPPDVMYSDFAITKGALGAIIGALNSALGGDNERYIVCGWLFNASQQFMPMSSKMLEDNHWYALYKWVGYWKDEDSGKWMYAPSFEAELLAVYSAAIRNVRAEGVDAQILAGRDPLSTVDSAVGDLGGKITMIVETDNEDPEPVSAHVAVPKSLRDTQYGRRKLSKEAERRLLKELGYDPDEESIVF